MREVALQAVEVDENVAMWTIICRTTVHFHIKIKCLGPGDLVPSGYLPDVIDNWIAASAVLIKIAIW